MNVLDNIVSAHVVSTWSRFYYLNIHDRIMDPPMSRLKEMDAYLWLQGFERI